MKKLELRIEELKNRLIPEFNSETQVIDYKKSVINEENKEFLKNLKDLVSEIPSFGWLLWATEEAVTLDFHNNLISASIILNKDNTWGYYIEREASDFIESSLEPKEFNKELILNIINSL